MYFYVYFNSEYIIRQDVDGYIYLSRGTYVLQIVADDNSREQINPNCWRIKADAQQRIKVRIGSEAQFIDVSVPVSAIGTRAGDGRGHSVCTSRNTCWRN